MDIISTWKKTTDKTLKAEIKSLNIDTFDDTVRYMKEYIDYLSDELKTKINKPTKADIEKEVDETLEKLRKRYKDKPD